MTKTTLSGFLFLVVVGLGFSQAPATPLVPPPKGNQPLSPKPIQTYQEVLAHVPADLRRTKATAWTQAQQETANVTLKETLIEPRTPAKLRLKVGEIAAWSGPGFMTFYSDVPNQEGYHIRVFGKFTDDWKPKLVTLKKGDSAILDGVLSSITYCDLWGQFTLSICLDDCTFTK